MRAYRLSLALVVVCLGLAAWALQQWLAFRAAVPLAPPQTAADSAPGSMVQPPAPPPMAPLASYSEIVERPLFVPTRRPPPPPEVEQPVAQKTPGNFKLEGTALAPGGRVAVVRNNRTSKLHRLAVGESIDGWQLDQVGPGQAALSQGAQKLQLELDRPTTRPVR